MNYHLIVVFHTDMDKRPCRPVVKVIHMAKPPETRSEDILANPHGAAILTTCQLCDPSINSEHDWTIDHAKIRVVYAMAITDDEAAIMINNVAFINTTVAERQVELSERSNIVLLPLFIQKNLRIGARSIVDLKSMSAITDVQAAIILIRGSMNQARSVCVRLNTLHPYMATPENFYDTISMSMRKINTNSFRKDAFKFNTS